MKPPKNQARKGQKEIRLKSGLYIKVFVSENVVVHKLRRRHIECGSNLNNRVKSYRFVFAGHYAVHRAVKNPRVLFKTI